MPFAEGLVLRTPCGVEVAHPAAGALIVVIHIGQVAGIGVACDAERGVQFFQPLVESAHAQYAAHHGRRLAVDGAVALENLGERPVHACGDVAVLLCAERRKVAGAPAGILPDPLQAFVHILAERGELAGFIRLTESFECIEVLPVGSEPAGAVTPVVADVEGPIACGRWGLDHRVGRIGVIDAARASDILEYLPARGLARGIVPASGEQEQ